jgi:hypothetical protein
MTHAGLASINEGLDINNDGSEAHEGEDFEGIFGFYGIEKGFFYKTWVLNDLEKVK